MKRLLVIVAASALLLTGCAAQANVSASESPMSMSPTPVESVVPSPSDTATGDPNADTGATPSDGEGDPLARTEVIWIDYPAGTQADIDAQTAAGDCKSLGSQLGGAKANEASVMAASGHSAEAILAYIDEALELASCS